MASVVSTARGRGRSRGRRRPRGLLARGRHLRAASKRHKATFWRHWETPNTLTGWICSRTAKVAYLGGKALYRVGARAAGAAGGAAERRLESLVDRRTTYSINGREFSSKAEHDKYLKSALNPRPHLRLVTDEQRRPRVDSNAKPPENYRSAPEMSNQMTKQFAAAAAAMVEDMKTSESYTDLLQKMTEFAAMTRKLEEIVAHEFAEVAPVLNLDYRVTKQVTEGASSGQLSAGLENACKQFRTLYALTLESEKSSGVAPLNLPNAATGKAKKAS